LSVSHAKDTDLTWQERIVQATRQQARDETTEHRHCLVHVVYGKENVVCLISAE